MAQKKEITINIWLIVAILILILAAFLIGYFSRKSNVLRKELRAQEKSVRHYTDLYKSVAKEVFIYKDSVEMYKGLWSGNTDALKLKEARLKELASKLSQMEADAYNIPDEAKYDTLQRISGRDTLPKLFPFSSPQINKLYVAHEELTLSRQTVYGYEDLTTALFASLSTAQSLTDAQGQLIYLLEKGDTINRLIINGQGQQIKTLKKAKNSNRTMSYILGGVAFILGAIALAK